MLWFNQIPELAISFTKIKAWWIGKEKTRHVGSDILQGLRDFNLDYVCIINKPSFWDLLIDIVNEIMT